jgi:hypothetical protein
VSRETVREAVYTYLNGQGIANVAFYEAMPKRTDALNDPGAKTTAVSFPVIASQQEKRLGMGVKQITYTVTLELVCFSAQQKGEDGQSDFDAIAESILDAIRADPALGTTSSSNPILQAGEGDGVGSFDLRLDQDLPVLSEDEAGLHIWGHLAITALEVVNT